MDYNDIYKVAFDLILQDDCINDDRWLGSLDELYEYKRDYYINKAFEIIKEKDDNGNQAK